MSSGLRWGLLRTNLGKMEEEMAAYSNILLGNTMDKKPEVLSMGWQRVSSQLSVHG